jgi:DNA-binding NtrC family response regulator
MLSTKRKLILFQQPSFSNEIYNELSAHDWDVYVAKDFQQASYLLDEHTFKAGLCLIDEMCHNTTQCLIGKQCLISKCINTQQLAQLHRLFNLNARINWIMGIPKECTQKMAPDFTEIKLLAEYCHDYITLPVDIGRLLIALNHAYGMNEIRPYFQEQISDYPSTFGIIGNSSPMQNLFSVLKKVAKEDCSVLIEGETGTGKELIANAIHNHSSRSKNPFIAINCGAFPKDLIQAELFGYEKGAFTGAQQRRIGQIESAQGGTLFLDEIGDLPFAQQVNLLRYLEDNTIVRIGGTEKIPINARVIAATHVDLKEAVKRKEFREDLYYRLRVLQIKTPPLRVRENDIELLAWYFFNKFTANQTYQAKGFHADTLYLLKNYDWPGNIRELMNCIRNAVVISENRLLTPCDLGLDRRYKARMLRTLDEARALADRESIITCLRHTNNNMSRAAETLGISRVSLYRLIDKYGINA